MIPGATSFLEKAQQGWRGLALRFPLLSLVPINMPPLVIWGAMNLLYNQDELISKFHPGTPAQVAIQKVFDNTCWFVNSTFYPLGIILVLAYMAPVSGAIRQYREKGGTTDPAVVNLARRRVLWWGSCLAWVAAIEWVIAGIVFPVSIHLFLPAEHGPVPLKFYTHFIFSQTLCGIMSLSLPWLATTMVTLKAHYPALLGAGTPDDWEQHQLGRLRRQSARFLVITIIVALAALMLMLTVYKPSNQNWLVVVVATAFVTIVLAFFIYQQIQDDLKVLLAVIRASDPSVTVSTSIDSI
jgi:eukaryotic-like serine/threonine-protein kinase